MKNKIVSLICLSLVLSFCFPSLNSYAASSIDYRIKTSESVSGLFPDNQSYELVQQSFCSFDGTNVDKVYSALEGLTPQYDSYALFLSGSTLLYFNYDPSIRLLFSCLNSVENNTFNPSGYLQWPNRQSIFENYTDCCFYSCNISGDTFTWSTAASISEYFGIVESDSWGYYWQSFNASLLDSSEDFYVYCVEDSAQYGGTSRGTIWRAIDNDENGSFTNFNAFNALYMNSDGDIVDPSGPQIESNENHMYFKDCDLGFCEPKNMTNFNNYGGAYVYCRYVVDDWVVNHISDYKIVVSMNTVVGGRQYGSSVTLSLDRDGCITVPFTSLNGSNLDGFTSYISSSNIEQDFYKCYLYSLSSSQLQNMHEKRTFSSSWEDFFGTKNPILAYISPTRTEIVTNLNINSVIAQKFDPYKIRLQCYLIDNDQNESGTVARLFDLVSGNDDSVDNSGLTNDNPFEPDTTDPDYTPTVPDGNSTYPQIVINNGGDWTGTFTGGFDPGYVDLKNDVNADPNGNFSQYLDPMHNDDVGSWFMSFVDEMPVEMKNILIAGVGVGVLFGLYRFIRRG